MFSNFFREKDFDPSEKPLVVLVANLTWTIFHYRLSLIQALQRDGYRVMVVAPYDSAVQPLKDLTGIQFQPLHHFTRNSTNPFKGLQMIYEFYRVYRYYNPALVIHFGVQPNVYGNLGALFARVHSICVVTGLGYSFLHRNLVGFVVRFLYTLSFWFAKKVLLENADDQELLIEAGIVARSKTAVVNGCGINLEEYTPQKKHKKDAQPVFTFIGRLLYDKGLYEYVQAAEAIKEDYPDAKFQILGMLDHGNPAHVHQEELEGWIRSGTIHYLGAVKDVRPYIADSDWIVLPSYREGLSRTLLEAMSMARPIITSDVAGCRQAVDHEVNGFLTPVRDAQALKEIFARCCTLPRKTLTRMGNYGRVKAKRQFNHQLVDQQYITIVRNVTEHTIASKHLKPSPRFPKQLVPGY
jgi:glycosyltransferase involved in cell wall biosynthesis